MIDINLYKENKKLKKKINELEEQLKNRNDDTIILDVVNAFIVQNKLTESFNAFLHTHSMEEVYRTKDEVRELWEKL